MARPLSWPSIAIGALALLVGALLFHSVFLGPSPSRALPAAPQSSSVTPSEQEPETRVEVIVQPSQIQPSTETRSPAVFRGPDGEPFKD